jgi:predicted lipoprotein with Yx(FWY)xxD motif
MRARLLSLASPAIVLAAAALVIAGCGSSDDSSTTSAAHTQIPARSSSGGGATVATARTPLGTILVDASGRTLYLWEADTGSRSTCSGDCAAGWPPLTASGRATAGSGAQASQLGTTKRDDGTMQVTYAGHPLYTFVGDRAAGDTTGQDSSAFGADWYVVSPAGKTVEGGGGSGGDDSGY